MTRIPRFGRRLLAVATMIGLALGLGGTASHPGPAAAIDPCYGYDLCVHLSVLAMGRTDEIGSGWVTSSPAGISCRFLVGTPQTDTSACDHYFHANFVSSISITLNAVADSGSSVICDVHVVTGEPSCTHPLTFSSSEAYAVTFDFGKVPVTVTIGNASKPGGFVYSTPMGIDCGEQYAVCSASWKWGTNIVLTAEGDGAAFLSWIGSCAGNNETCELVLYDPINTTAVFGVPPTPTPGPTPKATSGPIPTHTAGPGGKPHSTEPTATPVSPGPSVGQAATPAVSGGAPVALRPATSGPGPSSSGLGQPAPAGSTAPLDVMPIVIAIVAGFGLVALGIVVAAVIGRRGRATHA